MAQLHGWEQSPPDAVTSIRPLAIAAAGAGVLASTLWILLSLPPNPVRIGSRVAIAIAMPLLALGVVAGHNRMRIALGLVALLPAVGGIANGALSVFLLVTGGDTLDTGPVTGFTVDVVLSGIQAGLAIALCRKAFIAPVAQ